MVNEIKEYLLESPRVSVRPLGTGFELCFNLDDFLLKILAHQVQEAVHDVGHVHKFEGFISIEVLEAL